MPTWGPYCSLSRKSMSSRSNMHKILLTSVAFASKSVVLFLTRLGRADESASAVGRCCSVRQLCFSEVQLW